VGGKLVESCSLNYLESDTMWIQPKSTGSYGEKPTHLYINSLYPPEYAELDQARQHDTCYASTDLLEQHYNQVGGDGFNVKCWDSILRSSRRKSYMSSS
jgi:hypothetical protein